MGYGNYSHEAHTALTGARANLPTQQVFKQSRCHELMNPKGVKARECRDSDDHPQSLGIAFALDVTGSMGSIPEHLAKEELPKFMKVLMDCNIADPQVLFMAVGDATCDAASLQVGQFETTAELMDQWLTWSYLEGGGGGQNTESYELAMYFLAEHTDMDCWVKRKKRGYMFMTGDELPYPAVSRHQVEAIIGEKLDEDIKTEEAVAQLQQTFEPFFLIPDLQRAGRCETRWRELLGDHVICMESYQDTCYVAAALIAINEGVISSLDQLAALLEKSGADKQRVGSVIRAVTPYASALERDGAPKPRLEGTGISTADRPSGLKR